MNRSVLILCLVLLVAASLALGTNTDPVEETPALGSDRAKLSSVDQQKIRLELLRVPIAAVLVPSEDGDVRTMVQAQEPSRFEWERLARRGEGAVWHPDLDLLGATDSLAECRQATDEMCGDAGHGGVDEGDQTLTQHALADGGGCTCSGECNDGSGAEALITSTSPCGE